MNICVAVNHLYVKYLYVMLMSLFENNAGESIRVFILERDLTEEDKDELNLLAEKWQCIVDFRRIDVSIFEPILKQGIGDYVAETLFRFCILDILPADIERVLYFDVDILIRHSIRELYDADFEGNLFAACEDLYTPLNEYRKALFHRTEGKYFNAGVMLWNLELLRKEITSEDFFAGAAELDGTLECADQEVLNYLFYNRIRWMDAYRFNYLIMTDNERGSDYRETDPVIIHFAGCNPWKPGKRSGAYEEWWDHAKRSPYADRIYDDYRNRTDQYINDLSNKIDGLYEDLVNVNRENQRHFYLYFVYRDYFLLLKNEYQIEVNCGIVIYGAGILGERLLEQIRKDGTVSEDVVFVDQSRTGELRGVPIINDISNYNNERYGIIVTPAANNEALVNELKLKMTECRFVVSLRDFLNDCLSRNESEHSKHV